MQQTAQAIHNSLPRQSGLGFGLENTPVKRVFQPAKCAEEERRLLEDCIQKSRRDSTKWTYKIFNEWQMGGQTKMLA